MSLPASVFASSVTAWWCCPDCEAVRLCCPGCAEALQVSRPPEHPPALPYHAISRCPDPRCGAALALTVCGYRPNPTGDAPARRSPLSDPLPVAKRPEPAHRPSRPSPRQQTPEPTAAARLADFRRTFPIGPRKPRPKRPAPPPKPAPCPADAARYRLAAWGASGWLPDGVAPSAIAAAYRRCFGVEPRRDATYKTFRAYSLRELGMSLGELGLAPAPELRRGMGR